MLDFRTIEAFIQRVVGLDVRPETTADFDRRARNVDTPLYRPWGVKVAREDHSRFGWFVKGTAVMQSIYFPCKL